MLDSLHPSILRHLARIEGPRQNAEMLYPLPEILLLALAPTVAGADDFVETTLWGEKNRPFLRGFLPYTNGIPSHDTLRDVFAAINLELFKICFLAWVDELRDHAVPELIAIDSKTSERTHHRGKGHKPLYLVSAWAAGQRLALILRCHLFCSTGHCLLRKQFSMRRARVQRFALPLTHG